MIGWEEKGNFDKKEEVSDFPEISNRVVKKKRFEEMYGSIFRNLGTKKRETVPLWKADDGQSLILTFYVVLDTSMIYGWRRMRKGRRGF